jgi:hypothetical protein
LFNSFDSADLADMVQSGTINGVILHEMGHVLGIGNLWKRNNLTDDDNNYRVGTRATDVWNGDWGCVGTPPVEKDFGNAAFVHWDEECLGDELMTGFTSDEDMPFSRLTLASLEDIGYAVNYDAADDFDGTDTACCTGAIRPSRLNTHSLSSDGKDAAVLYGQKILSESQLSDDLAQLVEEDDTGLTYVGDRVVVVLYMEDGKIYEVFVGSTEEDRNTNVFF